MADHAAAAPAHQFDDLVQQREAGELGMWVFLATEVMFFGGMLTCYAAYRHMYPRAFAEGSQHLDLLLGSVNTAVLIGSSLTMVLAVHAARLGRRGMLVACLGLTILLGSVFLGIKGVEYAHKFEEHLVPAYDFGVPGPDARQIELFMCFYFALTGVHALHLLIGIGAVAVLAVLAWRGRFTPAYHNPVEVTGLYWHFVDIVWIFLLPLLYLVSHHGAP